MRVGKNANPKRETMSVPPWLYFLRCASVHLSLPPGLMRIGENNTVQRKAARVQQNAGAVRVGQY